MPEPTKTAEQLLAELAALGLSEDEIQRKARAAKVSATRNHFAAFLKNDDGTDAFTFEVKDWRAIREFLKEAPTQAHNPGGPVFEDTLHDTADAIRDKDAARLIVNLLLIYKANQRS